MSNSSPTEFMHLVERLRFLADAQPNDVNFTFLKRKNAPPDNITFKELDIQARKIAAFLQEKGLAPGSRVILLYPPGLQFIEAIFGCFYAGMIAVPLYPPANANLLQKLQKVIENCEPSLILCSENISTYLQNINVNYYLTQTVDPNLLSHWREPKLDAKHLAILQYTSGSTGDPKGVMVSHGNIMANENLIYQFFQRQPDDIGLNWLPPYHDMGLIGTILMGVYAGGHSILMSPLHFLENPLNWLRAITQYKATISGGPNFAYAYCAQQITEEEYQLLNLDSWRVAFNGAEPINSNIMKAFADKFESVGFKRDAFQPCYGLAEATLLVSGCFYGEEHKTVVVDSAALNKNQIKLITHNAANAQEIVSCGKPRQEIKIVDPENLHECKANQIGEIWIHSDSVAAGYWNQTKATEETFQAKLDKTHTSYLRTGDLGFLHGHELYISGRLKDLMIIDGLNYYPNDIENTVYNIHPEIFGTNIAAFTVPDAYKEQLIIVVGIPKSVQPEQYDALFQTITTEVFKIHHLTVAEIAFVRPNNILKTSTGKIRHYACQEAFIAKTVDIIAQWQAHTIPTQHFNAPLLKVAPTRVADLELLLKEYVASYLQIPLESISSTEPLANYGITSIIAVQMAARLSQQYDRELSPLLIYDYPTIQALSHYIILGENSQEITKTPTTIYEPIAIIGMQCSFPGKANSPDAFWSLLAEGRDAITDIPTSRWNKSTEDPHKGGFLEHIDAFDAQFFGISPHEACLMDPQHRILLETAWKAIEDANIDPKTLAHTQTGVYIGISNHDYEQLLRKHSDNSALSPYAVTGNTASAASGRISYLLGLQGPSISLDTACSSSLVAIDMACRHLQTQQCKMAIAGGVNLILTPETSNILSKANMLAPDGHCKVFDASADGYVRSEGCAVIILKKLNDALQDNDNILAIIRATGVNQDGSSQGFTAPNPHAQVQLIQNTLQQAGLSPDDIDYFETHGTGTQLGDPIETNAIAQVLKNSNNNNHHWFIGAVKSNIGHLEAAAGIAGLVKVVLALKNKAIPANLHFKQRNPLILLDSQSVTFPTVLMPWVKESGLRRAGLNSFGFTGTNAHAIIEEYIPNITNKRSQITPHRFKHQHYWMKTQEPPLLSFLSSPLKKSINEFVAEYQLNKPEQDLMINNFCFQYIRNMLEKLGYPSRHHKPVISPQQPLLQHFLKILRAHENAAQTTTLLDPDILCQRYPQAELEIRLGQRCGENLTEVMLGKINPLSLLFPSDSPFSAELLYKNSLYTKIMNELLQQTLTLLFKKYFKERSNLRILEIGAGTGGATHYILPILENVDYYTFTDISTFFLDAAKFKFSNYPFIQYQLLDIEQSPLTQGFHKAQYDIIICANVLHATKDIKQSLENIHTLLAPNGVLLLLESTEPSLWLDMTFGLLEGWWRFTDKELRPNYPILSLPKWKKTLKTYYQDVVCVTLPANTKQSLIITRNITTEVSPEITETFTTTQMPVPTVISEQIKKLKLQLESAKPDEIDSIIKNQLLQHIAQMLHQKPDAIPYTKDFSELGIDSLMAIDMFNTLQKTIGSAIILQPSLLAEYTTIESLAAYIALKIQEAPRARTFTQASGTTTTKIEIPDFNPNQDNHE